MNVEIYYFTATGNSLKVSREIGVKLNAELISIPSLMDWDKISPEADIIGIIFPVYYATNGCSGIPLIVERFLNKFVNIGAKYIFAVCTHSGMPGTTIENLNKIIKSQGGTLSAGFTLKTYNYTPSMAEKLKQSIFHHEIDTNDERLNVRWEKNAIQQKKKIEVICNYIKNKKHGVLETRNFLKKIINAPFLFLLIKPVFKNRFKKLTGTSHLRFEEMIPLADRTFHTNENCNGCGICARICPVNNIKMVNDKPFWHHQCETCLACYVWCPNKAIYGDVTDYANRYHHPNVKISDILDRKLKKYMEVKING